MADPVSMGLMAAGSLIKGVGSFRAHQANARAYKADALQQEAAGNAQALIVRDQARQAIGSQVAAQFANGFQGGTGSALQALSESQINATLDMLNTQREGLAKANTDLGQAALEKQAGNMALLGGVIDAGTGAYKAAKDWGAAKAGQSGGGG